MVLHALDAFQRLQSPDQNASTGTLKLCAYVQHEIIAIAEIHVRMATLEKHGLISRCDPSKMVSGGIALGVSFGFHDAAGQPTRFKLPDDKFPDQKTPQQSGVNGKFRALKGA